MKAYLYFVALLLSVGLLGCKPKQTTVTGQIFIVTRGSESIKLGGVEILLLEKQPVCNYLKSREPVITSIIESRRARFKAADEEYKRANAAYVRSKTDGSDFETQNRLDYAANNAFNAPRYRRAEAKIVLDNSPTAEDYLAEFLPTISQKVISDADGKFSFTYPRGKSLTVFAATKRSISRYETEKYYWLVDAPANAESAQLFLSNNNLVFIDPDDYFKLKPKQSAE